MLVYNGKMEEYEEEVEEEQEEGAEAGSEANSIGYTLQQSRG